MSDAADTDMQRASEDGMDLTQQEAMALALRLAAWQIESGDWLEWGNVPNLGEYAFERLVRAANEVARQMSQRSSAFDRAQDIDSAWLQEKAT